MNADFNDLALHIAHRLWKHKPVAATYQGLHDYDDRFALFNCEYLNAFAEEADDLARRLRRFKDADLDADERYERDLMRGALEIAASEVRDMEYHTRSADIYIADIIQGLWVLVLRDNRPIDERGEVVLGRLRGVWRVLREGTANLRAGRNVPKVWTEHGIQATEGALTFIENELEDFIDHVEDDTLREEIREAVPPARKAIKHYLDFLRLDMLASSKGRYGVGKDHYNLLLTKRHGIKMSVAEMRSYAEECVSRARAALEEFALAEGDGRTWQELVRDVRRDVPEIDDLPTIYKQAFERARSFVEEKDFVTVPDGDRTHYNWSPRHFRQFHPLIGVISPAPFESEAVSFAYATQMESTRQDEDRVVLMAPHCSASLPERAALNAFPGHLLRAHHTSRVAGRLPRFHVAYPMVFGWAAYARQLMEEHGFFSTPEERLFYLRAELIDAVRCLMDVRMHTEEHTLDEATTMFQDLLDCESIVAEREARRFTITPCEGFAYMWGRDQIRALRTELSAKKGFKLKRFHDELLGCGTLPFALVRERMVNGEALPFYEQKQESMGEYEAPQLDLGATNEAPRPVRGLVRTMMSPIASYVRDNAVLGAGDEDGDSSDITSGAPVASGDAGAGAADRDASNGHRAEEAEEKVAKTAAKAKPAKAAASKAKSGSAKKPATKKPAAKKTAAKKPAAKASTKKAASKSGGKSVAKSTKAAASKSTAKKSKPAAKPAAKKAAPKKAAATKAKPAAKKSAAAKAPAKKTPAKKSTSALKSASTAAKKSAPAKKAAPKKAAPKKPAPKKAAAKPAAKKSAAKKSTSKPAAKPAAKKGKASAKSSGSSRASRR